MFDTTRRMRLADARRGPLHDVRFAAADALDDFERQRLFPTATPVGHVAFCRCGWGRATDAPVVHAAMHLQRDPALPVHQIGAHTAIGSRVRNADCYGSAVDDTTGVAAFAVADGIGNRPDAAKAAAVAVSAALYAALTDTDDRAVTGMLAARAAIEQHGLVDDGDTVMVLAVSRPGTSAGTTWDLVWVGDCQGWLLDDGQVSALTRPHTQGQWLRDQGQPEALAASYDNVVLSTVGTADRADLQPVVTTTETGRLLLTSDGVGKSLEPADLLRTLSVIADPLLCAQQLVALGTATEKADNATALVIDTMP